MILIASTLCAQSIATLRIEAEATDLFRFGETSLVHDEIALISYDRIYSPGKNYVLIANGPKVTIHSDSDLVLVQEAADLVTLYLFAGFLEIDTHAGLTLAQQEFAKQGTVLEVVTLNGRVSSIQGKLSIDAVHPYHSLVVPSEIREGLHFANAVFTHEQSSNSFAILSSSICLQAVFLDTIYRINTLTPLLPELDMQDYLETQLLLSDERTRAAYAAIETRYTSALFDASYALLFGGTIPNTAQQALEAIDTELLHSTSMRLGFYLAAVQTLTKTANSDAKKEPLVQRGAFQSNHTHSAALLNASLRTLQIITLAISQ